MNPPAFQFYADDFLAGVLDMSREDRGDYIVLLCWQWSKGSIPEDQVKLSRIVGGMVSSDVLCKFEWVDGQGRNRRMEAERQKQADYRAKQSANAHKRWVGNANAYATAMPTHMPTHMPNACSPSPSPSPSPTPLPSPDNTGGVGAETIKPTPEQPKPTKKRQMGNDPEAAGILDHLSSISGRAYQPTASTLREIRLRITEVQGDTQGIVQMLDRQKKLWSADARMSEYLRPSTLFRQSKFHEYFAAKDCPIPPPNGARRHSEDKQIQERLEIPILAAYK